MLIHIASLFPVSQPKGAEDLILPAMDGTRRALRAAKAAGILNIFEEAAELQAQVIAWRLLG